LALPYAIDFGFSTQGKCGKITVINRPEKGIKKIKKITIQTKVVFLQTVNPKYLDVWLA
jgi:hypothetical protein